MKYKISIIFIVFYISSSRASHARRKAPRMQLSINDEIGYIKPINLGPNGKLNITRLLSLLTEHAKKQNHRLTSLTTGGKKSQEEVKVVEKRIEDSESKESQEDWFQETPKKKIVMALPDNRETPKKKIVMALPYNRETPKKKIVMALPDNRETPKKKIVMALPYNRGTDRSAESDRSDYGDEGPMMRHGGTGVEADLQYDLDGEDLRIALKK